jgi:cobalt-zinc-cadmium efflux system outer membrane protein
MSDISRTRLAYARARVDPVPNVSLQGLVNVIDNGVDGRPDAGVALTMPIPLFNRNQGAILKAQHEIAAAELALQQLELGLQNRLAPIYERYANARNQVECYRAAILPAAQETLDLTRKLYEAGEANFLSLLTAQRTFSQTNLNYLESLLELRATEAEINGLLLRNSLGPADKQ